MGSKKLLARLAVLSCAVFLIIYFISSKRPAGSPAVAGKKVVRRLFPVAHDNRWGFIDATGKLAIPPSYNFASEFSGGYAQVLVGEKWGYISDEGKMVIPPQFEEADRFV
ncbi:MAG TPA: WG repeat-containing protein, partial [Acidobacteriota bacterium]|nr:WG repeat-containing protein [Acidobacteriota bacterium]